jgi:hypothetical protein
VFYQECATRLNASGSTYFRSVTFLNAQNKQTERRIVKALRAMGIPAAAIVDLDIIKKGEELKELLISCNVPAALTRSWGQLRGEIYRAYEVSSLDPKNVGINGLPSADRDALANLQAGLREYGIFVVHVGELERWLASLGVTESHGPGWVAKIFERMGSDPESPDYARPSQDDVWDFLIGISEWIANPMRKGINP